MIFDIEYSNISKKFLKKLDKNLILRIMSKIGGLKENPVPSDAKSLKGYKEPTFRIRVGKYRVLYAVNHNNKVILISKIGKREGVYD